MSRILFIITQSEIGGAQRYLLELAPYLMHRGYHVSVAAGEGGGELFQMLRATRNIKHVIYYTIPNLVRNLNPIKDIRALFSILKIVKKEKPDIVFLQSTKAGFLGSLAAKLYNIQHTTYNIQTIYRIGGWAFNDPRPWWMNKIIFWMEKISAPWKDVIIVNSEFDRQVAIDKKIAPAKKIVKIYNGIYPEKLSFFEKKRAKNFILSKILHNCYSYTTSPPPSGPPLLNKERGNGGEVILVGTVANLYATKGIKYLIEAARILHQLPIANYKLQFIVIGEGSERPKLEALIAKYNLGDKFLLVGRIPNASQYLKAFDVFVLPSVKEGFPWVLLETMAAEVPIVATGVGAVPEIIEDGKEGLIAPPLNPQALSEKIHQLVLAQKTVHYSRDRGNSVQSEILVKNASKKLKQFSLQKMLEESEKTLRNE